MEDEKTFIAEKIILFHLGGSERSKKLHFLPNLLVSEMILFNYHVSNKIKIKLNEFKKNLNEKILKIKFSNKISLNEIELNHLNE
jgi:hypothetical protein